MQYTYVEHVGHGAILLVAILCCDVTDDFVCVGVPELFTNAAGSMAVRRHDVRDNFVELCWNILQSYTVHHVM